jgi:hypothetical protein
MKNGRRFPRLWSVERCDPLTTLEQIFLFFHRDALTEFVVGDNDLHRIIPERRGRSCVFIDLLCVLQSSVLR